jgi:hypothetical protein
VCAPITSAFAAYRASSGPWDRSTPPPGRHRRRILAERERRRLEADPDADAELDFHR